jgi:hypothetical protein
MKRYTPSEIAVLVLGVLLGLAQIMRYALGMIEENSIEKYVGFVWILLVIAPKKIVSLINKLIGK